MPASNFDFYLQDARNNFDAVRPVPVPSDVNVYMGQSQNIHISTNCYYGYACDPKNTKRQNLSADCEMLELDANVTTSMQTTTAKKRSADNAYVPQSKRQRQEVQKENTIDPETNETMRLEITREDLELETLYWNIHGGNFFHLVQCL